MLFGGGRSTPQKKIDIFFSKMYQYLNQKKISLFFCQKCSNVHENLIYVSAYIIPIKPPVQPIGGSKILH